MSSDTIQLSEVTDKALFYWLKKARNEGLTAMEAACLAYDFIPPKNATSSWRLPEHIESLYEKIDRYIYNSIIYEKQYKDWEKSLKLGFFGTSPEYIYTFDTIKQAINDADLGFIPKLIQLESTNNDENLCINVVNDSNISIVTTKDKTDKEKSEPSNRQGQGQATRLKVSCPWSVWRGLDGDRSHRQGFTVWQSSPRAGLHHPARVHALAWV